MIFFVILTTTLYEIWIICIKMLQKYKHSMKNRKKQILPHYHKFSKRYIVYWIQIRVITNLPNSEQSSKGIHLNMKCQNPLKKYQNVLKCISIFNKQYTIMQFCGYQVNSIKKKWSYFSNFNWNYCGKLNFLFLIFL
jgi:hypothetical protein